MNNVTLQLQPKGGEPFYFPVLPERLNFKASSGNESLETIKLGEITVFGNRKLRTFDVESIFPNSPNFPFCNREHFSTPQECISRLNEMQEAQEPVEFILSGLDGFVLNKFWVSIESFEWEIGAGPLTINYTLSLKEYRPFGSRAKELDTVQDLFGASGEKIKFEAPGQRREPTGYAVGDHVIVSGVWYQSWTGAGAVLSVAQKVENRILDKPWTLALEAAYKAANYRLWPLKERKCVIIDVARYRMFDLLPDVSSVAIFPYCVADLSTRNRIGWVAESSLTRL